MLLILLVDGNWEWELSSSSYVGTSDKGGLSCDPRQCLKAEMEGEIPLSAEKRAFRSSWQLLCGIPLFPQSLKSRVVWPVLEIKLLTYGSSCWEGGEGKKTLSEEPNPLCSSQCQLLVKASHCGLSASWEDDCQVPKWQLAWWHKACWCYALLGHTSSPEFSA